MEILLITGATGFIECHLAEFSMENDINVVVLDHYIPQTARTSTKI